MSAAKQRLTAAADARVETCRRKLGYPFKVVGHWGATAACLRERARARRPH
jgi:hypothetical protein